MPDRCPNRTRPGAVISRVWTTSPRLPCSSRACAESNRPWRRPQTANSAPAPEAGVLPSAPLPVRCQSERPRPIWHPCQSVPDPAISWPPTRRDTRLRHVLIKYPVGESNPNPAGIRSPSAAPLDGAKSARTMVPVGWEALESSSPALQTGARPSQLPAHQRKKPGVAVTPGFC